MKNNWLIFFFSIVIFSSCKRDMHIDTPKQAPRLVLNAIWDRNNDLKVIVTRSFSLEEKPNLSSTTIQGRIKAHSVSNATVVVYKDGVPYDELVFDTGDYTYKSATGKKAIPGSSYTIKATAPGFADVLAPVLTFPEQVPIKSVEVKKNVTGNEVGNVQDEIIIEFDDPAATKNFYWLTIVQYYTPQPGNRYYNSIFVDPVDKDIVVPAGFDISTSLPSINGDKLVFKDDNFNGKTKRMAVRLSSWVLSNTSQGVQVFVSLNNVNEDLFKYVRSRVLNVENPFSSPMQTYSNITNGLGIFGLYAGDTREVK